MCPRWRERESGPDPPLLWDDWQLYPGVCRYHFVIHNCHPQTKLREGNVFTPVCDSIHGGGVYPSMQWARGVCIQACNDQGVYRGCTGGRHPLFRYPWADTPPPSRHPPGRYPMDRHTPSQTPALMVTEAHPTGMHSCCKIKFKRVCTPVPEKIANPYC